MSAPDTTTLPLWAHQTVLLCEIEPDELVAVVESVAAKEASYFAFYDEESDPVAVLIPYAHYVQIVGTALAHKHIDEAIDEADA